MPRKPDGDRALTHAERQARLRQRKAARDDRIAAALQQVLTAQTLDEAHAIAAAALAPDHQPDELFDVSKLNAELQEALAAHVRTYGDPADPEAAQAKSDQAWGDLFYRSGWTVEQLAQKEGISPERVEQLLLYNRFIRYLQG